MAYNEKTIQTKLVATIAPAKGVDKALDKLATSRQALAVYALGAMRSGELTLDGLRDQMVQAWQSKLPVKEREAVTSLKHCSSTYSGIYYDIRRVFTAGKATIARVVDKGEALTKVRGDTAATQGKGKGKAPAKGKGKANKLPSMAESLAALNGYIAAACADGEKALALANNKELATLIANIGKLEKAAAKAAKAATRKAA